jgi:rhodanese-related sulfurtransferase
MDYLFIIFLILILCWDAGWYAMGVLPMFPWKLKNDLAHVKESMTILDVRTSAEFNLFHIDGVIHLPEILAFPDAADRFDRHKPVLVICMTGHRSAIAAYMLKRHGFLKVYSLSWGMIVWKLFGGPTVKS